MSTQSEEPLPFEEAMKELEQIVRTLEDGGTALEEAMSKYEKGVGLLKQCYGLLEQAEQRIQALTGETPEGQPVTANFEHLPTANAVKQVTKSQRPSDK
jgi:exodeoxyribonuclease VII small subunit